MVVTEKYFKGWLAEAAAFGPVRRHGVEEITDQYRAAQHYLDRMREKPRQFQNRAPSPRSRGSAPGTPTEPG